MKRLLSATLAACTGLAVLVSAQIFDLHSALAKSDRDPRGALFARTDLISSAQIGAWDMDGGTAVHNALARANVVAAQVKVIRWQMWRPPCDLRPTNCQTTAQFDAGIDGIRSLGAEPLIGLPPIWNQQCADGPDAWSYAWQQWIVRTAGPRVQLYEMANEPDSYCGLSGQSYHEQLWTNAAPLKKYARGLGLTTFIGGPAWTNSYREDLADIQAWLSASRSDYLAHGNDRDYLPDFVSVHTYLSTPAENATRADALRRIEAWATFFDRLQTWIDASFTGLTDQGYPIGRQLKLVVSEYNDTTIPASTINDSQAWTDFYFGAMFALFRAKRIWIANEFTIASENGALDLLNADGSPKPAYFSFKAQATAAPTNPRPPRPRQPLRGPTLIPTATPNP